MKVNFVKNSFLKKEISVMAEIASNPAIIFAYGKNIINKLSFNFQK